MQAEAEGGFGGTFQKFRFVMNRRKRQSQGEEMYDRTDRYVLGMMDEEERTAFEKDMKEDASLADSVSLRRMVVDEVRRREELRDTFLAIEAAHPYQEGAPADHEPDRRRKRPFKPLVENMRRRLFPVISFAVAVCLVCGIFIRHSYVSKCRDAGYSVMLANVIQPSRGDSPLEDILKTVEGRQYGRAEELIAEFRSAPAPECDLTTEEGNYLHEKYLADCRAVDYIEAVMLLCQGHPCKAKRILKSLVAAGSYYSAQSARLLEVL